MPDPARFLDVVELREEQDLAAGEFGSWLDRLTEVLAGSPTATMAVPCGACTACCRSALFVHIGADEADTLARIPEALLVPAPGRPADRVMGFDDRGHCPMLVDDACTIYPHRPRSCRAFDCRLFAAAGVDPEADGKTEIAARARRWRFDYTSARDRRRHRALVTAARLIDQRRERFGAAAPGDATRLAVAAVTVHEGVLALDERQHRSGATVSEAAILEAVAPAAHDPQTAPAERTS